MHERVGRVALSGSISLCSQDNKLSIHVCDDEVYFFPSPPITPLKVASPALLNYLARAPATVTSGSLDDVEDSQVTSAFDESSNQMDTSFSDAFMSGFQVRHDLHDVFFNVAYQLLSIRYGTWCICTS